MTIDEVMAEIKPFDETQAGKTYSVRAHISENDIERWSVLSGEPRDALYDQIAIFLARGFHNFALSFEFCDAVVNDIHSLITNLDEIRPTVFREIFQAFDEGEYCHNDQSDEDPSEVYTRPMIARILKDLPRSHIR